MLQRDGGRLCGCHQEGTGEELRPRASAGRYRSTGDSTPRHARENSPQKAVDRVDKTSAPVTSTMMAISAAGGEAVSASDGTLVLGTLNGDRSAFAELYDRRARLIRAICYDTTRSLDAAADLTQDVFLRAYRDLSRLRDPQNFARWLAGIARQVCREWLRKQRRERNRLIEFARQPRSGDDSVDPPDERLVDLRNAMAGLTALERRSVPSLTDKERLALHAFYLQGRNVEEARAVLGLSRSGFYRVLSSACQRLRRILSRQEVQP
jgi:RNA polymerase sigma factor (sigma-70 family)